MKRALILLLPLSLSACPKAEAPKGASVFDNKPVAAGAATGATAPAGTPAAGVLPPGHPPMGAAAGGKAMGGMNIPPPDANLGKGAKGLTWTAPKAFISETPTNKMRRAQFKVAGEKGDASLVVFYFGPGQGGDPLSNAQRWANQFTQPDGKPSTEAMKTANRKANGMDVLTVEVVGTYGGGMSGGAPSPDQMLLGAVVQGPDAPWFFKLTGPKATVEANRKNFGTFLDSLKPGA